MSNVKQVKLFQKPCFSPKTNMKIFLSWAWKLNRLEVLACGEEYLVLNIFLFVLSKLTDDRELTFWTHFPFFLPLANTEKTQLEVSLKHPLTKRLGLANEKRMLFVLRKPMWTSYYRNTIPNRVTNAVYLKLELTSGHNFPHFLNSFQQLTS